MDEQQEKLHLLLPLLSEDWRESHYGLWKSATVLPEQFPNASSNFLQHRPEIALMLAVLQDALCCFQEGVLAANQRRQRSAREAEEWFLSDESHWPFSFLNICYQLNLEPQYIRRGLRLWSQSGFTRLRKSRRRVRHSSYYLITADQKESSNS